MSVPAEIEDAYKRGERVIRVSPQVFEEYAKDLKCVEYSGPPRPAPAHQSAYYRSLLVIEEKP